MIIWAQMSWSQIAVLALIFTYITIPLMLYIFTPKPLSPEEYARRKRAIVLVLGDLGRSPRMSYHALSLAKGGLDVDLCGYVSERNDGNSGILQEILDHPRIKIHPIPVVQNVKNRPFVIFAPYKVLIQHYQLYKLLRSLKDASFLIVQNPPSIPVLFMARYFVLFVSRAKLVIDWHNLGFSILGLKFQGNMDHPFVKFYRWYESFFGARAWVHLTVTVSLGDYLRREFKMNGRRIIPLHDRPASHFRPLSSLDKRVVTEQFAGSIFKGFDKDTEKIIVTSTSYTPDEDLYLLLEALELYALKKKNNNNNNEKQLPKLRVIITGKGPMMAEIQARIAKLQATVFEDIVSVETVWLAVQDYPKVIGTADLGISLHQSSSGYDLPMKILDMFGVAVPVISVNYPTISELVKQDKNGILVDGKEQMADALIKVFTDGKYLDQLKQGAAVESRNTWDLHWNHKVGPLFGIGEYLNGSEYSDSSSSSDDDDE